MRFFAHFIAARQTYPDPAELLAAVRLACGDPVAEAGGIYPGYTAIKATDWTPDQRASAYVAIETCPALTPQRQAQNEIDAWPISMKAFALALVDQLNVLRIQAGLAPMTNAQALAAIRQKASQL